VLSGANFLENEAEFLELYIPKSEQGNVNIKFKTRLELSMTIGEMPGIDGSAISAELTGILTLVSQIITEFETFFP
jgi:hypothetical protein